MSRTYGKVVEFRCANDCEMIGCPGHTIQCVHNLGSDTYSFTLDGKQWTNTYDESYFAAMVESWREVGKHGKAT